MSNTWPTIISPVLPLGSRQWRDEGAEGAAPSRNGVAIGAGRWLSGLQATAITEKSGGSCQMKSARALLL